LTYVPAGLGMEPLGMSEQLSMSRHRQKLHQWPWPWPCPSLQSWQLPSLHAWWQPMTAATTASPTQARARIRWRRRKNRSMAVPFLGTRAAVPADACSDRPPGGGLSQPAVPGRGRSGSLVGAGADERRRRLHVPGRPDDVNLLAVAVAEHAV